MPTLTCKNGALTCSEQLCHRHHDQLLDLHSIASTEHTKQWQYARQFTAANSMGEMQQYRRITKPTAVMLVNTTSHSHAHRQIQEFQRHNCKL